MQGHCWTAPTASPAVGRTVLQDDIGAGALQIRVVDGIRVPDPPCWAWISGELVLVTAVDRDMALGHGTLTVERGTQARHLADSWARNHEAGTPVTFARSDDVFIHSKLVLVDDMFASIGSANMNRRSMFHDGEISAQVVPGRLRAALPTRCATFVAGCGPTTLGSPPTRALLHLSDPLRRSGTVPTDARRGQSAGAVRICSTTCNRRACAQNGKTASPCSPRSLAASVRSSVMCSDARSTAPSSTRPPRSTRSSTPIRSRGPDHVHRHRCSNSPAPPTRRRSQRAGRITGSAPSARATTTLQGRRG